MRTVFALPAALLLAGCTIVTDAEKEELRDEFTAAASTAAGRLLISLGAALAYDEEEIAPETAPLPTPKPETTE